MSAVRRARIQLADGAMPVVFSLAGERLTPEETALFRQADPLGFILFARNVGAKDGLRRLCEELRACVGRDCPILIDQEGGRVRRLRPPEWHDLKAMGHYGAMAEREGLAPALAALSRDLLPAAQDMRAAGIDVDCAPVLDLAWPGAHAGIGDRAFSADPEIVAALGGAVCEALLAEGISPVLKHMPGHGRAKCDSHEALPVIEESLAPLAGTDFAPFRALAARFGPADQVFAMAGHLLFRALDPDRPAGFSEAVVREILREEIGFQGLLMSDDLSMGALSGFGTIAARVSAALAAGLDIALYCAGDMNEMSMIAENYGRHGT